MNIMPLVVGPIVGKTTAGSVRLWGCGDGSFKSGQPPRRCFGLARIAKGNGPFGSPVMFKMKPHFDFTGIVNFGGLNSDTAYRYQIGYFNAELEPSTINEAAMNDSSWSSASDGSFITAPSSANKPVSFVFGSCRYLLRMFGGSFFDDRGDKTFRSIMKQVREKNMRTDFALMVGDQIYADDLKFVSPDDSLDEFNRRYREVFSQDHIRDVMSHMPTYMILDDHEIRDNWSQDQAYCEYNLYVAAMQSYHSYQLVHGPAFDLTEDPNVSDIPKKLWYAFRHGSAKIFVMDTRTERFDKPEDVRDMIGSDQMNALKQWLTEDESSPVVRFVVSSVPFFPEYKPDPSDKWAGFTEQRAEILDHIREHNVKRVVFLGGDVHCSMTAQLAHASDPNFKVSSVISSSFFWPYPQGRRSDFKLSGHLDQSEGASYRVSQASKVWSEDNFTRVSYDPAAGSDKLVVRFFSRKGKLLQTKSLSL